MPRKGYRKDDDHRHLHRVSTYLTPADHARFLAHLEASGLTRAAYVRAALTGVAPRARPGAVRRELVREINRIGVNLNQLAKRANAGELRQAFGPQLDEALAELKRILPKVIG